MAITLLIYSLFTGLSGIAHSVEAFLGYRFLVGLGVGGFLHFGRRHPAGPRILAAAGIFAVSLALRTADEPLCAALPARTTISPAARNTSSRRRRANVCIGRSAVLEAIFFRASPFDRILDPMQRCIGNLA